MINPKAVGTFNLTFKTTNEGFEYIRSWIDNHTEIISDSILPDTSELYKTDEVFKKMVKDIKKLQELKMDYIIKNNDR
jgi:hypothetical protein